MKHPSLRLAMAALLALAPILASVDAHASPKQEWFLGLEGYSGWLREAPTMTLHSESAPRGLVGLTVPGGGNGLGYAGAGADVGIGSDKVVVRLLHLRFARGFTSYSFSGSAEGSPVGLGAGSTSLFEASFFPFDLLGFRTSLGDGFRLQGLLDSGIGYAWGGVYVTGSTVAPASYTFDNVYAYVRAELDACGRLGDRNWLCLSLQPNIVEFGSAFPLAAFNGGSIGLRVEL